jgi:hypothetical protein
MKYTKEEIIKRITAQLDECLVPDRIYKEAILTNNFSLKELTGLDIYMVGDMQKVRLFRRYEDGQTRAISLNIPYYDKHHPEKMEATKFNMFAVFEYTKRESYTTQEIDWTSFKGKFNECLLKLCRYCI